MKDVDFAGLLNKYFSEIDEFCSVNEPRFFVQRNSDRISYERGRRLCATNYYMKFIGTRIASIKQISSSDSERLIQLWTQVGNKTISLAREEIEWLVDFSKKNADEMKPQTFRGKILSKWVNAEREVMRRRNLALVKDVDKKEVQQLIVESNLAYIYETLLNIDLLEFDQNELGQTLNDTKGTIREHLNFKCDSLTAAIDIQTEEQVFADCKLKKDYGDYLRFYPNGRFARKAKGLFNIPGRDWLLIIAGVAVWCFLGCLLFVLSDWRDSLEKIGLAFLAASLLSIVVMVKRWVIK